MSEAADAIDCLIFKSESVTSATRVDFAGGQLVGELSVEQFMFLKRVREFQQILHSRITAASGRTAIRQSVSVRMQVIGPHSRVSEAAVGNGFIFRFRAG